MNNTLDIRSSESEILADMYFAEEEEFKLGIHPTQIIERMIPVLYSNEYPTEWKMLEYNEPNIVTVIFEDGRSVKFNYESNVLV